MSNASLRSATRAAALVAALASLLALPPTGCVGPADGGSDSSLDAAADGDGDADVGDLPPWPEGRTITPGEVYERLVAGDPEMLLLNVVDEEFYDMGCIEGSLQIPWDLLEGRLDEVDPSGHVVIYCRLGVRSESAFETLSTHGYDALWIMDGGLSAWIDAGYPTVPVP